MQFPVQTSDKQGRAVLLLLPEEIEESICSWQLTLALSTNCLFMFMFLTVLRDLFSFFFLPWTHLRHFSTPLSSCRPLSAERLVEKWTLSSVRATQGCSVQSKALPGWRQNQRPHKHCALCVFVFLPRSLSLSLCWKGYPGSLAPRVDSLAAVGRVSVNNTYILHISAECSPACIPRLNYWS